MRLNEVNVNLSSYHPRDLQLHCRVFQFVAVLPFGVLAILSDILIAAALCLLLASNRSEFDDTNTVVNRLIVYAINRCVLTSCVFMFTNTSPPNFSSSTAQ